MTKLEKYTKQHAETVAAMKALLEAAGDDGDLSADQQTQYNEHDKKRKSLAAAMKREAEIEAAERIAPAISTGAASGEEPVVPRVRGGSPRAAGQPFATLGEQLVAVVNAGQDGAIDPRLYGAASGAAGSVGSDGGFLIQKDFVPELIKEGFGSGELASRCSKHEVGAMSDGLEVPYIDETSRVNGSRWGGVQVFRRAEAETVSQSKPKLGLWECRLEDMMGLAYLTDRLMRDAPAMEGVFREAFRDELGFKLDDEIFRGTGVGSCLGVTVAPALVTQAAEGGQTADTIVSENISKMWARVLPRSKSRGAWFINTEITPQLDKLALATGSSSGQLVYMPPGGLSERPYGTIKGRPVIEIEQASAIGDVGDISFLDLSWYKLISKGGVEEAESIHVRFLFNEKALRWTTRVNGAPKLKSAITPYKGANTLSPFVTLAAR